MFEFVCVAVRVSGHLSIVTVCFSCVRLRSRVTVCRDCVLVCCAFLRIVLSCNCELLLCFSESNCLLSRCVVVVVFV